VTQITVLGISPDFDWYGDQFLVFKENFHRLRPSRHGNAKFRGIHHEAARLIHPSCLVAAKWPPTYCNRRADVDSAKLQRVTQGFDRNRQRRNSDIFGGE